MKARGFNAPIYVEAVTHRSWAEERAGPWNERLEFLGDAVLKLLAAELVFQRFPDEQEDRLSAMVHQLVGNECLARLAEERGLGQLARLGRGEERQGGRRRPRLLAGLFEAILGAVYLDQGIDAARDVVVAALGPELQRVRAQRNAKVALQELAQARTGALPRYQAEGERGPPHQRTFRFSVHVGDVEMGVGEGPSKKAAQAAAAQAALARFEAQ